jgi:hypothetical protein
MRRGFRLPESDETFLNALGRPWETIGNGGGRWLLIHERRVPTGYNVGTASEAYRIDVGYPDTQIDMVYFLPHLSRVDGCAIGALSVEQIDGQQWQRWSRHRTPEYPWRPGEDDISTHLVLVDHWLEREFRR